MLRRGGNWRSAVAQQVVLDASAFVAALLPDEPVHAAAVQWLDRFRTRAVDLVAPTLLTYEIANSVLVAERRTRRLPAETVDVVLDHIERLQIELVHVSPTAAVATARRYGCAVYDAAYLWLADDRGIDLVTADRRLWASVHTRSPRLRWIEARRHQ
jgi:predicted nucleic acid-binding protein